jgi:protein-S-isoprenylcysteine O-methyltransferase Ste14
MGKISGAADENNGEKANPRAGSVRLATALKSVLALSVFLAVIFLLAGRLDYPQGWLFGVINAVIIALLLILVPELPDLMKGRAKPGPATKWWDRFFWMLFGPMNLAVVVVASLDGGRFHWTDGLPFIASLLAVPVYAVSSGLHFWAIRANAFYSSTVSIQGQSGQTVVEDGPYRYVRHPGYTGIMGMMGSIPLLLGSVWGLVPAAGVLLLVFSRTILEDLALRKELPGYLDYARRVRYRLVPGLW